MNTIGLRREDKPFERRVPLVPEHVSELIVAHGISFVVEPSPDRAFTNKEFESAGARLGDIRSPDVRVVLGIKEMPSDLFEAGNVYVFFSHTIKGQEHNMPMLRALLSAGATLIDYECIVDDSGRRLIFFGNWAGMAGMADTLRVFGARLAYERISPNPFLDLPPTYECASLDHLRGEIAKVAERIESHGLPASLKPVVVGFAGYGNVSRGAQELFDILPHETVAPEELDEVESTADVLYKCVFKEEHMVEPADPSIEFDLQDYYRHGSSKYRGVFERYIPYLTVLMNCIFWADKYPRLVTKRFIREHWVSPSRRLKVVGDISCDLEGAIEFTVMTTNPESPAFTYLVDEDRAVSGVEGNGPVVMAIDNLPTELPRESSRSFSETLRSFVPHIAKADFDADFGTLDLPPELMRAVIVYRGQLTPDYEYLHKYLEGVER